MRTFFLLLVCCIALTGAGQRASAAGPSDETAKILFDIPPQPLGAALFAYTREAGAEVFVDDELVAGRQSAPLRGAFDPEMALRTLLAGSGLAIRRAAPGAFTLVGIAAREPPRDRLLAWSSNRAQLRFYAAVQAAVKGVLCSRLATQPGRYRAALAVWVDPAGVIDRVRLLTPDVEGATGEALVTEVKGLSVGEPPPAAIAQPVIFVVLPRAPGATGDCQPTMEAGD
jgi:hypothetical protein